MQELLDYSFDHFEGDIRILVNQIKDERYDLIVGITRGGLYPAIRLSHILDIPMIALNYSLKDDKRHDHFKSMAENIINFNEKKILIVEDIADSGKTLEELFSIHLDGLDARAAALIYKPRTSCFKPNHIAVTQFSDHWIRFFWEFE